MPETAPPRRDALRLRDARPDEAALLSELARRSKAYWGYDDAFMLACRDELTWTHDEIAARPAAFVVAEANATVVGFYALAIAAGSDFELDALFVEPAWIGRGAGRALIEHARRRAAALGARRLAIQGDPHAERFYLAAGAVPAGYRESGSIPGRELPLFVLDLAPAVDD